MISKLIKCIDCGKEIEVDAKDNKTIRCPQCQDLANYTPIETKIIKCIDCGKEVEVDALDNQTNRCDECYVKYRKKIINENAKRYYYNKKKK